jgi:hypothetical protein
MPLPPITPGWTNSRIAFSHSRKSVPNRWISDGFHSLRESGMTALPLITARIAPFGGLAGGAASASQDVTLLVDTGAAITCIADEVIFNLSLDWVRQEQVSLVSGPDRLNMYMAEVGIFPTDDSGMRHHRVEIGTFLGQSHIYQGLLGRDLLAHYDFRLTACRDYSLVPV